ncbi:MAG: hypothetical protein JWN39_1011 [Ilumatobacteraceae bacterium]|nr:hypothetical protein [Ilumatobacteraceae bacterium]
MSPLIVATFVASAGIVARPGHGSVGIVTDGGVAGGSVAGVASVAGGEVDAGWVGGDVVTGGVVPGDAVTGEVTGVGPLSEGTEVTASDGAAVPGAVSGEAVLPLRWASVVEPAVSAVAAEFAAAGGGAIVVEPAESWFELLHAASELTATNATRVGSAEQRIMTSFWRCPPSIGGHSGVQP